MVVKWEGMRKVLRCQFGQLPKRLLLRNQTLYLLAGTIELSNPLTELGRSWVIGVDYPQYARDKYAGTILA